MERKAAGLGALAAVLAAFIVAGCITGPFGNQSGKTTIAATFYPLYDITEALAGDKADVFSIIPQGVEPHDYEPSSGDFVKISNASAFATMGLGFAQVEQKLLASANREIKVIEASKGVPLIDEAGNDVATSTQAIDPHIWLSPKNMEKMALNMRNGLVSLDQNNEDYYNSNAQSYISKLEMLDANYRSGLAGCNKDVILVNHQAFGYLAKEYGFRAISISGLEPDVEPSPGKIAELIGIARENNIRYILFEELADPKVANIIAREAGAATLELNPVEGTRVPSENYFTLMEKNLATLRIAMECG